MSVSYHVYRNDGAGGPVNYGTPVATTTTSSASLAPPGPGDWTYAVRAFDPATGLEESNVAARARLVVGTDGTNQSAQPRPVAIASANYRSTDSILVRWHYGDLAAPLAASFRIRLNGGATPVATVGVNPGQGDYAAVVPVVGSGPWSVAVTVVGSTGLESGPLALSVVRPAPLRAVDLIS